MRRLTTACAVMAALALVAAACGSETSTQPEGQWDDLGRDDIDRGSQRRGVARPDRLVRGLHGR